MQNKQEIIRLDKVTKTYLQGTQQIHALKSINFSIEKADFLAIHGPSGSGKSSFLNLISLIDKPTEGVLYYQGKNVNDYTDLELSNFRSRKIGIIFQNYNLFPVFSAVENVAFPLHVQGIDKKEATERARVILKEVGLGNRLDHRPAELSGGQKQRVAIARALVTNPEIVVADEPTAALDSKTGAEIIQLIKSLNESKGITFVFSTHDPQVLKNVNNVLYLKDGLINQPALSMALA